MKRKALLLLIPFAVAGLAGCQSADPGNPTDQCDQAEITLNKTEATLKVGESVELVATAPAACSELGWGVDEAGKSVVSLEKNGTKCTVHALAAGTAIVGYGTTASCTITVVGGQVVHVTGIYVQENLSQTMNVDSTLQLHASVNPENATNKGINYSSSDDDVATVSGTGLISALEEGTANITVSSAEKPEIKKTVAVTVVAKGQDIPVTGIKVIKPTNLYPVLPLNETLQIEASVEPAGATNKGLLYESDHTNIATVSSTGLITPVAVGSAKIDVIAQADSSIKKTIEVTVKQPDVDLPSKTSDNFVRVEAGDLKDGDEVRFICASGESVVAMKQYLSSSDNNHKSSEQLISGDVIEMNGDAAKFRIHANSDGTYSFEEASGKFLAATGGKEKNYLKVADGIGSTSSFNVTIVDGAATIICADEDTTHNALVYNEKDKIFNCYTDGSKYKAVSLYTHTTSADEKVVSMTIEGDMAKKTYKTGDEWNLTGVKVYGITNLSNKIQLTAAEYDMVLDHAKPQEGDTSLSITATLKGSEGISASTVITGITVTAADPIVVDTEYVINPKALSLTTSYTDGEVDGIKFNQLIGTNTDPSVIQGNKSKNSELFNKRPFSKEIESVEVKISAGKHAGNDATSSFFFGTAAQPATNEVPVGANTSYPINAGGSFTITPTAGCKYFDLTFTGSYACYFEEIVIHFAEEQKVVTKLEVETLPNKREYYQNETLDTNGMVVKATYEGDPTPVDVTSKVTVSPTLLDTIGDEIVITVSFGNQSDTFNVKVSAVPAIQSLSINADDMNKDYKDGETISLEGVKVYANYEGGASALLTSDKYDLSCDPTEADIDSKKTTLTASLKDTTAGVPDATLDVTLNVSEFVKFQKATNVAVGDVVSFVCEGSSVELTSFENNIGKQTAYTDFISHSLEFEVVAGAADGQLAFKNGSNYLELSVDDNKLGCSATSVTANSSWIVSFDIDGNAVVTSVAYPERSIRYNSGSPRFACYKGTQNAVQLFMAPRTVSAVVITAVNKTIYEGDTLDVEDVDVTITYKNGVVVTGAHPTSLVYDFSTEGEKDLVAKVGEVASAPFKVTVLSSRVLTGVEITSYPDTVEVGTVITKDDVKVTLTYSKGDPETDVTPDSITVGDTSVIGSVELTATVGTITSAAKTVTVTKVKEYMNLNIPMKKFANSQSTSLVAETLSQEYLGVTYSTFNINPSTGQGRGNQTAIYGTNPADGNANWHFYNSNALDKKIKSITLTGTVTSTAKFQNHLYMIYGDTALGDVTEIPSSNFIAASPEKVDDSTYKFVFDCSEANFSFFKLCTKEKFCSGTMVDFILTLEIEKPEGGIKVDSVELNKKTLTLAPNGTETLEATVGPSYADNKELEWSSDDTNIAVVDQTGKVTAVADGKATITATAKDGSGVSDSCVVTVQSGTVVINPITLSKEGGTSASDATVKIPNGDGTTTDVTGAIKCGTGSVFGAMNIVIPKDATKLVFYAAAWKGENVTLSITGLTETKTIGLTADSGIANNTPFTLSTGEMDNFYKEIDLGEALAEATTITLTATGGKRFVVWSAGYVK